MKYNYEREKEITKTGDLEFFGEQYHFTGFKARMVVYFLVVGIVLFVFLPWFGGWVWFFKSIF